jgi:hypothetical protein
VEIYIGCQCGLRTTSKIVAYLNERFNWGLLSVPSMGSIKNWVEKCGYSIYKEPLTQYKEEDYAIITDESMMIGSEKMLLTLGMKAEKKRKKTLSFQDVDVLDISVERSWNGERIANVFAEIREKLGKAPSYILSDNASIITKAVRKQQYVHIPDVSHSLAMYIERKYKNDKSFIAYTKAIAKAKNRENMRPVSYLLPPKQRVLARFMNITPCIVWAKQILSSYNRLTQEEQTVFAFIKDHTLIIEELHEVTQAVTTISSYLKSKGASRTTIKECLRIISFMGNSKYNGVVELSLTFKQYLIELGQKLPGQNHTWHVSSDIIESCFGKYKGRKSCNPLDGVTRQVLILPILTKLNTNTNKIGIDFKQALEMNSLSDLKHWSSHNLTENLTVKRRHVLNAA